MYKSKIRQTQRLQEIINVFLRKGFSYYLYRLGLTEKLPSNKEQEVEKMMGLKTKGKKIREALQELGPTFVKLGQILSTRKDFLPLEIIEELEKLQDDVKEIPFASIREIIEEELGDKLETLFSEFEKSPLAAASIGQVHQAKLPNGGEVAVKVQRPDIEQIVKIDIEILLDIARLLEDRFTWAKNYRINNMVEEFSDSLRKELDYRKEGRNGERIAKQLQGESAIHIPAIYWDLSSKKVLTMELVKGIKVNDVTRLDNEGYDRKIICERISRSMIRQMFEFGFFHGDPHPGNIYILPDNIISYLDFGMVGRLSEEQRYHFSTMIINVYLGKAKSIVVTFAEMGLINNQTDTVLLTRDIEDLIIEYYDTPISEISLSELISQLLKIMNDHQIEVPNDITILGKAMMTLETVVAELDPNFNMMEIVEPFAVKIMQERAHPYTMFRRSLEEFSENMKVLKEMPRTMKEILSIVKEGKLKVEVSVSELSTLMKRMDRMINQLSFSIILLSFSILMGGLIIGASFSGQTTVLWELPVIEIGSIVATLMFLFLIYSIFRSGKL